MERLCREFNDPQQSFRVIHIAGTNGKGSVAAMLEAVLVAEGCAVGCFTSPHLIHFNERMRAGGRDIDDEALLMMINRLVPVLDHLSSEGVEPTSFEVCNLLAFLWFKEKGVEWAIVETGMGGRLDSTNIVRPEVSVITSIGLDHREFLGDTLEEIAGEKAGIIKPGRPVVLGPVDEGSRRVILDKARELGSPVVEVEEPRLGPVDPERLHRKIEWQGRSVEIGLAGAAQGINAALCLQVIEWLRQTGHRIAESSVTTGLRDVVWAARFQRISQSPEIILDGAHNEPAWRRLLQTWMEIFKAAPDILVFGCLSSKWNQELAGQVKELAGSNDRVWLVCISGEKSVEAVDFLEECGGPPGRTFGSVEELWSCLMEEASDRRILIAGSLYLAGQVLSSRLRLAGHAHLNG